MENKPNLQVVTFTPTVNEKLVTFLEDLLKDAKDGTINQVITVIGYSDGYFGHGWSINGTNLLSMVGEIECAKHDYMMKTLQM
jgi:hypothetical protein